MTDAVYSPSNFGFSEIIVEWGANQVDRLTVSGRAGSTFGVSRSALLTDRLTAWAVGSETARRQT